MVKKKKIVIMLFICIVMTANILTLFSNIIYAIDEELSSIEYAIHDDYIERVLPKTDIKEFKEKLQEDVIVYTDEEKTTPVESGIIKTGMIASKTDGTQDYQISVIGDINRDGICNQIDLGMIMKHILGFKDSQLTGIELKSADVKFDEKVNQIDLTATIVYIVFGRMENDATPPEIEEEIIPGVDDTTNAGTKYLEITEPTWKNEAAQVILINKSKYKTQYKILNPAGEIVTDWTTTEEKTKTVEELHHHDTVFVRLTDDEGHYGKETQVTVSDDIAPTIELSEQENYSSESVTITAKITEKESGIAVKKWEKGSKDATYFADAGTNFTGETWKVQDNDIYTVYVKDKAGNEAIENITVTKMDQERIIIHYTTDENQIYKKADKIQFNMETNREFSEIHEEKVNLQGDGAEGATITLQKIDEKTIQATVICGTGNGALNLNLQEGLLTDKAGNTSVETNKKIATIDNEGPIITSFRAVSHTTNSIEVQALAMETAGIGIDDQETFSYYISTDPTLENEVPVTTNETTHQFTGLTQGTTYYLRVVAKDKLGNKTVSRIEQSTTTVVPDANDRVSGSSKNNVEFTAESWSNHQASITVTNHTTYHLQYKILNEAGAVAHDWTNAGGDSKKIENLSSQDKVLVRLADTTELTGGNYGSEESHLIIDTVFPSIIASQQTGATNDVVTVFVNSTDNESGVQIQKWAEGEHLDEEFFATNGIQFSGNSFQVSNNGRYTVYAKDFSGNETIETIVVTAQDKSLPLIKESRINHNVADVIKKDGTIDIVCIPSKELSSIDASKITISGEGAQGAKVSASYHEEDKTVIVTITGGTANGAVDLTFEQGAITDTVGNKNNAQSMKQVVTVDNQVPEISDIRQVNVTSEAITLQVSATDVGKAGLSETEPYAFYISDDENHFDSATQISDVNFYTFKGLKQQTTYYIKVEVKDNVGNVRTSDIQRITTKEIEIEGSLDTVVEWSDGKAKLTPSISNSTYTIQYKVVDDEGRQVKDWTNLPKGESIENLNHQYQVIFRLSDTSDLVNGNYSAETTQTILDNQSPVFITVKEQDEYTTDKVKITLKAQDNETGVAGYKWEEGERDGSYFNLRGNVVTGDTFTVTKNGTYTVYAKDKAENGVVQTIEVTKIDTEGPTIDVTFTLEGTTIKANVNGANDAKSGMPARPEYKYYISETAYQSGQEYEEDASTLPNLTTHEYKNLQEGKTYYVWVTAKDNLGNIGISEVKQVEVKAKTDPDPQQTKRNQCRN